MMTIWKYKVQSETTLFSIPGFQRFISVQMQYGDICLWAEVNPDGKPLQVTVVAVPTGKNAELTSFARYIGTVQNSVGLVFHIYQTKVEVVVGTPGPDDPHYRSSAQPWPDEHNASHSVVEPNKNNYNTFDVGVDLIDFDSCGYPHTVKK